MPCVGEPTSQTLGRELTLRTRTVPIPDLRGHSSSLPQPHPLTQTGGCPHAQPAFPFSAHARIEGLAKRPLAPLGTWAAAAGRRVPARPGPVRSPPPPGPRRCRAGRGGGSGSAGGAGPAGAADRPPGGGERGTEAREARGAGRSHALGLLRQREPLGRLPSGPGRPQQRLFRGRAQRGAARLPALHHLPHPLHR